MATESFTNAYLLSENTHTGAFSPIEQIAGSATITDPSGGTLLFGDPVTYTDAFNSLTLLYDGPVTENGVDVGFAAVDPSNGDVFMFTDASVEPNANLVIDTGDPTQLCFVAGTRIGTPAGPRAVESLVAGEMVCTADGGVREVKWIGVQAVTPGPAVPAHVLPIRIGAGALGDNLPVNDLLVSADHALLLDGTLVHARALVNGGSIVVETASAPFTYYHIETEDHAVVLAEGVAAETYADRASRASFDNAAGYAAAFGDEMAVAHMDRPRAKSARQVPYAVRARIAA